MTESPPSVDTYDIIERPQGQTPGVPVQNSVLLPVEPRCPITIRTATQDDFAFIDALQKQHSKAVGFLHKQSIETYIARGDVLIADSSERTNFGQSGGPACSPAESRKPRADSRLGYCISRDTYFKREDTGIIYQINIVPGQQRGLIGAMLLKEVFERAPYGVKLYCCWCAQDLGANHFWEAMGFTPLAFRTGSARKQGEERMHIFWQKRIRQGDTQTPWWFPSETRGGAIGEGRIVIPIPVGMHWSEPMPVIVPGEPQRLQIACDDDNESDAEADADADATGTASPMAATAGKKKKQSARRNKIDPKMIAKARQSLSAGQRGGLRFGPPPLESILQQEAAQQAQQARAKKKKIKMKNNPKYVAAARELRDRFLEQVEQQPHLLDGQASGGKYDVSRMIDAGSAEPGCIADMRSPVGLLHAA